MTPLNKLAYVTKLVTVLRFYYSIFLVTTHNVYIAANQQTHKNTSRKH